MKNESHILEEWINHYIKMGVDKILLINIESENEAILVNKISKELSKKSIVYI